MASDIFDIVAAEQPKGDIFDQVVGERLDLGMEEKPKIPILRQAPDVGMFSRTWGHVMNLFTDPQKESAEAVLALVDSEALGIPSSAALRLQDTIGRGVEINPQAARLRSTLMERLVQSKDVGVQQNQIGELGYRFNLDGDLSWLEEMENIRMPGPEDIFISESRTEDAFRSAAKLLPMTIESAREAGVKGITLGMLFGTAAALAGQPELVPFATFAGLKIGGLEGFFESALRKESGLAAWEMLQFEDADGNKIDHNIVRAAALGIGAINAALEVAEIKILMKTIPGVNKLLSQAILETVTSKSVKSKLLDLAVLHATTTAKETVIEVAQEANNILFEEIGKKANNLLKGTDIKPADLSNILERLYEVGKESAQGMAVIAAPGIVVQVPSAVIKPRKAKVARTKDVLTSLGVTPDEAVVKAGELTVKFEPVEPVEAVEAAPAEEIVAPEAPIVDEEVAADTAAIDLVIEGRELDTLTDEEIVDRIEPVEAPVRPVEVEGIPEAVPEVEPPVDGRLEAERRETLEAEFLATQEIEAETDKLLNKLRTGVIPTQRRARGKSLVEFLRDIPEGIEDVGGELAAMDIDKGKKPFERNVVREGGIDPDQAVQRAHEAGYFPGIRLFDITPNELFEAASRELAGDPVFSIQQGDEALQAELANLEDLERVINELDVGLEMSNEEIKAAMRGEDIAAVRKATGAIRGIKGQIAGTVGIKKVSRMIREDKALTAAWKKAEQSARVAFREGKRAEGEAWKVKMLEVTAKAREKIERKQILDKLKTIQKKNARSGIAVEYKKQIDELLEGIDFKNITSKKHKRLQSFANYLEKKGTPLGIQPKYIKELRRLAKIQPKNLTTADLNSLLDTVKHLKSLGRLKAKLAKFADARELEVRKKALIDSTINLDRKPPETRLQRKTGRTGWHIFYDGIQNIYLNTLHTFRVADTIDGFKNYGGENARIIKEMIKDEQAYNKNYTDRLANFLEQRTALLGDAVLTEADYLAIMLHARFQEGSFDAVQTLANTYGIEIPFDTRITTTEELKQHVPISDTLLEYVDLIRKTNTIKTDDIAALHEEITNTVFDRIEDYFAPLLYEREAASAVEPDAMVREDFKDKDPSGNFVMRTRKTKQGFTRTRVAGVKKVPRIDIEAIVDETISAQEWYLSMQPIILDTASLVLSREYQEAAGSVVSNWWRNQIDIVSRKGWQSGYRPNAFSNMLRQVRGNLTSATLLLKASTVMMQPFAVFDAIAAAQTKYGPRVAGEISVEFMKAWFVPQYAKKLIAASEALKQRKGGEVALEEILEEASKKDKIFGKLKRLGVGFIVEADVRTAAAVRQGFLNVFEKMDITDPGAEADFMMNLTQGSAGIVSRPHILSSGEGARTWFTFQTFFLNRWGLIVNDLIRGGIVAGDYKTKFRALVGLSIMILAGFGEDEARELLRRIQGKRTFEKDAEDIIKDIIFYIPEQIPYIGNIIESARRGWGGADIPIESVGKKLAEGIFVDIPKGRIGAGVLKTGEAAATLTIGAPGTAQAFDLLEAVIAEDSKKGKFKR